MRQSGRTTRMLRGAAMAKAQVDPRGYAVVVVADKEYAYRCAKSAGLAPPLERQDFITPARARHHGFFSSGITTDRVFVDHYVYELAASGERDCRHFVAELEYMRRRQQDRLSSHMIPPLSPFNAFEHYANRFTMAEEEMREVFGLLTEDPWCECGEHNG